MKPILEYLYELEDQLPDPDEGKPLKPEFEQDLRQELARPLEERLRESTPLSQVMAELP